MQTYCVAFAGHRHIDYLNQIEMALRNSIRELLRNKDYVEFYIGQEGDFDTMALSVIRGCRKEYGTHNSALNLVLPYAKANMNLWSSQFSSIIIPPECSGIHPKSAITVRNRWMVNHSQLLICYIAHTSGGAAQTFQYAMKQPHIEIRNLFSEDDL